MRTALFDTDIQQHVLDELTWDPAVEGALVSAVVDDGVVTLRGIVGSNAQKWAAERAAFRVRGVRAVADDVTISPVGAGKRSDTEIARAVAGALERDSAVPDDRIFITVADGQVTLEGQVDWYYQQQQAVHAAGRVRGVASVIDHLTVTHFPVSTGSLQDQIQQTLSRSPELDAGCIHVEMTDGWVTLTGTVGSRAESHEAADIVWSTPGVTGLINMLVVKDRKAALLP